MPGPWIHDEEGNLCRNTDKIMAENDRLRAATARKDVALHRALKFILLSNKPNANDLVEQINRALERAE